MGVLVLLFLIFLVTVIIIWVFPPDNMADEEGLKASVKDLWGVVKICQTSNFGKPSLKLKPAKRSVEMNLHFPDADRVILSLPLLLNKQKKAKKEYLKLFSDHDLTTFESKYQLTVYFDRKSEKLGHLIASLYREVFEASDTDIVGFTVKAITSDIRILRNFQNPNFKFNDDYKCEAPSVRHKGKSISEVQRGCILNAVNWLLYPPMIILSYKFFDLTVMCWAALFRPCMVL